MTTIDVAALRALMEKATKGNWEHLGEMFPGEVYATTRDAVGALKSLEMVCEFTSGWRENVLESAANMALIAAMKRALPALLDAYEELARLRSGLQQVVDQESNMPDPGVGFYTRVAEWALGEVRG